MMMIDVEIVETIVVDEIMIEETGIGIDAVVIAIVEIEIEIAKEIAIAVSK